MSFKVCFRCDAGIHPEIGTGHITRSLFLAKNFISNNMLKKKDILFLTRNDKGFKLGKKYLEKENFNFEYYSNNELSPNSLSESKIINDFGGNLIILDRLKTKKSFIKSIKQNGKKVVTFDDLGDGREISDLAVSAIFSNIEQSENLKKGLNYLILSKQKYKPIKIKKDISNIVATFGGYDARDFCKHFLENLKYLNKDIEVNIILGNISKRDFDKYLSFVGKNLDGLNINFYVMPTNFHEIISKADIAISSGGLSIFEFVAYGIPTIGLPQYKHQLKTIQSLSNEGICILGSHDMRKSNEKLTSSINFLIDDFLSRKSMSEKAIKKVDGDGINRINNLFKHNFGDIFHG